MWWFKHLNFSPCKGMPLTKTQVCTLQTQSVYTTSAYWDWLAEMCRNFIWLLRSYVPSLPSLPSPSGLMLQWNLSISPLPPVTLIQFQCMWQKQCSCGSQVDHKWLDVAKLSHLRATGIPPLMVHAVIQRECAIMVWIGHISIIIMGNFPRAVVVMVWITWMRLAHRDNPVPVYIYNLLILWIILGQLILKVPPSKARD